MLTRPGQVHGFRLVAIQLFHTAGFEDTRQPGRPGLDRIGPLWRYSGKDLVEYHLPPEPLRRFQGLNILLHPEWDIRIPALRHHFTSNYMDLPYLASIQLQEGDSKDTQTLVIDFTRTLGLKFLKICLYFGYINRYMKI
jgi:hypothetical protein